MKAYIIIFIIIIIIIIFIIIIIINLQDGGDGGSSIGGGVLSSGRNDGLATVNTTCSDVAFKAATASSWVTLSKLLSFT